MWNFINEPSYYGVVNSVGDGVVLGVGYDNFEVTKALFRFRVQIFYTWQIVISGSGTLDVEDKTFHIKCGDMFFIPPDVKMRYYPDKQDPWEYVWFSLNGETADNYGKLVGFSRDTFVLENRYNSIINGILKNLFATLSESSNGHFGVLSAFYKIMDICVSHVPTSGIQNIKAVIDANCMSQFFSIESLCRDVGISHVHLLRLFKNEYGDTLIGYITKKRIEYACELLATTELSVRTVAFSCGFSDEIHFMKTFKKSVGITALQYRNKKQ